MTAPVALACRCGQVRGRLDPAGGSHALCYCRDCAAGAHHITGVAPSGPADIFQTTPDRLTIDAGFDNLAAIRLSPKGLVRWYARCCATPFANTMPGPGLPFVGLSAGVVSGDDRAKLGPVICEANMRGPDGKTRHRGFARAAMAILRRAALSRVLGRERRAPFFGADDAPARRPEILSREDRARAYGV